MEIPMTVNSGNDFESTLQKARAEAIASIKTMESRYGIELEELFDPTKYSYRESITEFRRRIVDGVNAYQHFETEEGSELKALGDTEYEPNVFISRKNALIVRGYRGQQIVDWVMVVRKNLDAMGAAQSTAQFVAQTLGGTLIAVGVPVAIKVATEMYGGAALKAALMTAVKGVGLKSAIIAVALALAAILYWLLWGVEQKILGVVINDTDTDYYVPDWRKSVDGYYGGNLYMEHGTTENFMVANLTGSLDSPEIQLKSRFADENDDLTMVAAGLYFADRKGGFRGAEGIYVFIPYPDHGSDLGFAYQFAIPYTKDNRNNIDPYRDGRIDDKDKIARLFRTLYDAAKVNVDKTDGSFNMQSNLSDARGGRICGITMVSTPITYG
jgi:hypothetical protein